MSLAYCLINVKKNIFMECRKNSTEDLLCTKVKYIIESYPNFLILLFDMLYNELTKNKDNIFKITENHIILNINKEYKLKGLISLPKYNHYISIIFNSIGHLINERFQSNNIFVIMMELKIMVT